MKEWICRELSTSTGDNENGVLMIETELIRCKDCIYWNDKYHDCTYHDDGRDWDGEDYCSRAKDKEKTYFLKVFFSKERPLSKGEEDETD